MIDGLFLTSLVTLDMATLDSEPRKNSLVFQLLNFLSDHPPRGSVGEHSDCRCYTRGGAWG